MNLIPKNIKEKFFIGDIRNLVNKLFHPKESTPPPNCILDGFSCGPPIFEISHV
jgi:hypothetical protein